MDPRRLAALGDTREHPQVQVESPRRPATPRGTTLLERPPVWTISGNTVAELAPEPSDDEPAAAPLDADAVVSAIAGGARRPARHGTARRRRPAVVIAAAVTGVAGVALTIGALSSPATGATTPQSEVAAEIHDVQAATGTVSPDDATDRLQELAANRAERTEAQQSAADQQADEVQAAEEKAADTAVAPVDDVDISSGFGQRWGTLHAGVDFAGPIGTPEYAVMDGVVLQAGPASGFGQAVYIQHANGDVTVYGHMEKLLVKAGDVVTAGDEIALMGAEGESTGPHLHLEVHVGGIDGTKIDPLPWLRKHGLKI